MHKVDKVNLVQSIFVILVAASVGCGDGSQQKLDAGGDGPPDLAAKDATEDAAKSDSQATEDAAKSDGQTTEDAAKSDGLLLVDVASPDTAPSVDANLGETAPDLGQVDVVATRDGAETEARQALDTAADEAGKAVDATPVVDALAMTMATITFELANPGTQTVYLRDYCWLPITVTSAADGSTYDNQQYCGCNCADSACNAAVMCGPCAPASGVALEPGKTVNITWTARKSTLQSKLGTAGDFQCVAHASIATGTYRVAVVVYPTEADAVGKTNGKTTEQSFELGTTNATVEVPTH